MSIIDHIYPKDYDAWIDARQYSIERDPCKTCKQKASGDEPDCSECPYNSNNTEVEDEN
jgi:hypothetical protein